MAVQENDLIVGPVVVANGVSTISLDYFVEDAGFLEVYKSGSETPLILNTDYTFAGEGTSDGVVTLTVPGDGVAAYAVYLIIPFERTSDLQLRGEFKSAPFNTELDRVWRAMQGLRTRFARTLRLSVTSADLDPLNSTTEAERASRVLIFNDTGEGLAIGPGLTDLTAVAGIVDEIDILAGIAADVSAVAAVDADVSTVAGISANVTTVAGIAADVTTVAADAVDIGLVAGSIADVNSVADKLDEVQRFSNVYLDPAAADPTTRDDGSELQAGDLYFNTVGNTLRIYTGSVWSQAVFDTDDALFEVDIGVSVQAYSANLAAFSGKTAPTGAVVGTTDTQTLSDKTLSSPVLNGTVTGTALAGQATMEAGLVDDELATPLGTAQAIAAQVDTAKVLAETAGASVGDVGTYALLSRQTNNLEVNAGDVLAGSTLRYSSANGSNSGTPSGQWECCGYVQSNATPGNSSSATLFLRVL